MSFRISRRADRDLDEIWQYIAGQASPETADRIDAEIHEALLLLAENPGMGHARPEAPRDNYRFWSIYHYLIIYRMEGRTLVVVRVIHGARDVRRVFRRG